MVIGIFFERSSLSAICSGLGSGLGLGLGYGLGLGLGLGRSSLRAIWLGLGSPTPPPNL